MMDPFLLLTPILVLAVIALVRFIGCDMFFGVHPIVILPALSISPMTATEGDPDFTLTANSGASVFTHDSVVQWNSQDRPTTFVSDTQLTAQISAADIVTAGTATVTVRNSDVALNSVTFTITSSPVTVTFDNPSPPGNPTDLLTAPYKNLDFGTTAWIWVDPATGGGPANGININTGPNPGAGDISFVNGTRRLLRIRVFPKRPTTTTISDRMALNPQVSVTFQAVDVNIVHFIETGWTVPTQTLTIGTDIGFDLIVDTIIYEGPP